MKIYCIAHTYSQTSAIDPLPELTLTKALQYTSSQFMLIQQVYKEFDDKIYDEYIVKSSKTSVSTLTKVQSENYLNLLEGNRTKRKPPMYNYFFRGNYYSCHFFEMDDKNVRDLVYKMNYTRKEMSMYTKHMKYSCQMYYTSA